MNVRQRILEDGNFHCPCCHELLKDSEKVIAVSMYVHRDVCAESEDVLQVKNSIKAQYTNGALGLPKPSELNIVTLTESKFTSRQDNKKSQREQKRLNKLLMEAFLEKQGDESDKGQTS